MPCAASVSFNQDLSLARAVNVRGTVNVIAAARVQDKKGLLRRVDYVGTTYVAASLHGTLYEGELPKISVFHNTYERTKWEAEHVARQAQTDLPLTIFRPSIVVGDSKTGYTSNFRVLYWPLRVLASGLAVIVPADRAGILDIVPSDFVTDAFDALTGDGAPTGGCYNLAAGPKSQSTFGEILDMGIEFFGVRRPWVVPPALFHKVLKSVSSIFLWGKRRDALKRAEVYFPYFSIRANFDTSQAQKYLSQHGIGPPRVADYFRTLMTYCVHTNWGQIAPDRNA